MIDTVGSGIRRVFNNQKAKYFPMPDYDFDSQNAVTVTIYGKIIDENYTRLLFEKTDLTIEKVLLLDRVQKGYSITREQSDYLKRDNLVEGRFPRIYISSNIAQIVDKKVDYMENKGLDNTFYKDYIVNYLKQFKQASRQEINNLIYPKLPMSYTESDKNKRTTYLLTYLRRKGKIINIGSDTKSIWMLRNN